MKLPWDQPGGMAGGSPRMPCHGQWRTAGWFLKQHSQLSKWRRGSWYAVCVCGVKVTGRKAA